MRSPGADLGNRRPRRHVDTPLRWHASVVVRMKSLHGAVEPRPRWPTDRVAPRLGLRWKGVTIGQGQCRRDDVARRLHRRPERHRLRPAVQVVRRRGRRGADAGLDRGGPGLARLGGDRRADAEGAGGLGRARRRASPVRPDQRLEWPASAGRDDRGPDPRPARGSAAGGRELRVRDRGDRGGRGESQGDRRRQDVAVNGGQMARQALEAGLLDEIGVDLVPVLLGAGTPLFADLGPGPSSSRARTWSSRASG